MTVRNIIQLSIESDVLKLFLDVCSLRLDFEMFSIRGPAGTVEAGGGVCDDTFTVTVSNLYMRWVMGDQPDYPPDLLENKSQS